jgi:phosphatidylinositol-3-phosphatase
MLDMKYMIRLLARPVGALAALLMIAYTIASAQAPLPRPDHVVVVLFENHSFAQIIGSPDAPYINALANDSSSALFTDSYAITHPSQPNYIDLYSGCNQGVLLDFLPTGYPWTSANLGRQLIDSGYTWASFSEDLPSVGWDGETNLAYVRRHNPAANWVGTGTNQIPASTNRPFTDFPTDFSTLPTVCFVAPNLNHDMHDGSITTGDTWLQDNLDAYVQWAKTHNSLLIFTYDEDDGILISSNHITTIFAGQPVKTGHYNGSITHYYVLRTIEAMYGLPYICNAANALTITECWRGPVAVQGSTRAAPPTLQVYPNPSQGAFTIDFPDYLHSSVALFASDGKCVHAAPLVGPKTDLSRADLAAGLYLVKVTHPKGVAFSRLWID